MTDMMRLASLMLCLAMPASAQSCMETDKADAFLATNGWTPHAGGQMDGATATIYTHPDGRWWAVIVTNGEACIAATGTAWGDVKPNA